MNSIVEKRQCWLNPTLTGNEPQLTPDIINQALNQVVQGPYNLYHGACYPMFMDYPLQDSSRDMDKHFLKLHKRPVVWFGELPCTLHGPAADE